MAPERPRRQFRAAELLLLGLGAGIALVAALPLASAESGAGLAALRPALLLIGGFLLLHLALSLVGRGSDEIIVPLVFVLMGLGLALNQRVAPALAGRQAVWLLVGLGILAAASCLPYPLRPLKRYRYSWAILGILLVALTLVAGHGAVAGGPRLWLGIGGLSFQPSEVLKLLLVIFLAGYLEDKREVLSRSNLHLGPLRIMPLPYLAPLAVLLGLSLALLAAQGDLGAGLLLFTIALGMLYLASGRPAFVLAGLALFAAGAWLLYRYFGIVQTRVAIWRDPWADPSGTGYQLIQGLMALAAGGFGGTGLNQGLPTLIPAVHTDFIYAAAAEELGLAGATAILMLYLLLALRGFRVALRAPTVFGQLLAAGLTLALSIQCLIILAGVVKLIPLTGITMPFLSYGGTSVLTSALAVGLILRLSREAAA